MAYEYGNLSVKIWKELLFKVYDSDGPYYRQFTTRKCAYLYENKEKYINLYY